MKTPKLVKFWQVTKLIRLQLSGHSSPTKCKSKCFNQICYLDISNRTKCHLLSLSYNTVFIYSLSLCLTWKIKNCRFYHFPALMVLSGLKYCLRLNTHTNCLQHLALPEEWHILGHYSYSTQFSQIWQEM